MVRHLLVLEPCRMETATTTSRHNHADDSVYDDDCHYNVHGDREVDNDNGRNGHHKPVNPDSKQCDLAHLGQGTVRTRYPSYGNVEIFDSVFSGRPSKEGGG